MVWLGHYLSSLLGECLAAHKIAYPFSELFQVYGNFMHHKPYMQAFAGQPSLHGYDACMIYWAKGEHYGKIAGKSIVRPLFLLFGFFC